MAKAPHIEYRVEEGIRDADGEIVAWRSWDSYSGEAIARRQFAKCSAPTKRLRLIAVITLVEETAPL